MAKEQNQKRHFLEVDGSGITTIEDSSINTFRKVSHSPSEFIKVPVNIGEMLKDGHKRKSWKDFKLYVKFLDLKVQNPNCGTFQIFHSHRYYQRVIKQLTARGWAWREGRKVFLKAYQHVWRDLGITRVNVARIERFKYWKIPISTFSEERKTYLKEIEDEIRKRITKRKLAQIRYALKEMDTQATFSAMSAGSTFGYRSPSTGSKLRQKYFSLVPTTPEESKPRFNKAHGRYEEPTRKIAL